MKKVQEWIEYIKENVHLHSVLQHYGIKMNHPNAEQTQFSCPFHNLGGDKKPSARVYENGTAYCWGCGESFDTISFVKRYEGKSFSETLRFIEKTFNLKPFHIEYERDEPLQNTMHEIFEAPKVVDIRGRWDSVNNLLVRNKSYFSCDRYVKFCIVLDKLHSDMEGNRIEDVKIISLLTQIKDKILMSCNE